MQHGRSADALAESREGFGCVYIYIYSRYLSLEFRHRLGSFFDLNRWNNEFFLNSS